VGAWGTAGYTGTFTRTLTIPANTAPGTYYLGFIVDHNNAIAEANEGNNWAEMPIPIIIK
jgi:subtilase family serine protease